MIRFASFFLILILGASTAAAQTQSGAGPGMFGKAGLSMPMQLALSLTLLTLLPGIIMCITPFLRITIVLHFLRQALGTQTAPSNQVLLGIALFLAMVIMQPVASDIYTNAWQPLEKGQITSEQAF